MKHLAWAGAALLSTLAGASVTAGAGGGADEHSGSTYATAIAPILAAHCAQCHGPERQKGGLALDSPEAILRGGDSGAVLDSDRAGASELLRRLRLPLEDVDHMPPEGQPQPPERDVAALTAWVVAGASFDTAVDLGIAASEPAAESTVEPALPPLSAAPAADSAALAALNAARVHAEPLAVGRHELWVDVAAVAADVDDARAVEWLTPLTEQVVELKLARSRIGAGTLLLCRRMPRLERLDLRSTPVDDAALAGLTGHARLRQLVLSDTRLSAAAVATLASLPRLRHLYLWNAGLSEEALAQLRSARPQLAIDTGLRPAAAVLEVEPEPRFQRGAADPSSAEPQSTPAVDERFAPVNADCPVSGSPIDPRYLVVHEGRVIGFCCSNCPKAFWSDPAKFEAQLPAASR